MFRPPPQAKILPTPLLGCKLYDMYLLYAFYTYIVTLYVLALKEIALRGTKFEAARVACILAKCVTTRLWEQSKFVSKLIPKVGPVLAGDFVLNGKTTLKSIRDTDPRDIERVSLINYACEKMPKLGMFYGRYGYNCFSNSREFSKIELKTAYKL